MEVQSRKCASGSDFGSEGIVMGSSKFTNLGDWKNDSVLDGNRNG